MIPAMAETVSSYSQLRSSWPSRGTPATSHFRLLFPQGSTVETWPIILKGVHTPAPWTAQYLIYYFNWELAAKPLNLSVFEKIV